MKTLEDIQELGLMRECIIKTARSGGKGGQNVNKVETKVELWFDIRHSEKLSEEEKARLLNKLATKLDKDGLLHLQEQSDRTQLGNKELLKEKFYKLILSGLKVAKPRKPTKISKAVKARRLDSKKAKSELKQSRKKLM